MLRALSGVLLAVMRVGQSHVIRFTQYSGFTYFSRLVCCHKLQQSKPLQVITGIPSVMKWSKGKKTMQAAKPEVVYSA